MLIGIFVVGTALANFDFEREQIREYYQKRYGPKNSFNYAYVFSAKAKAIQSAGKQILLDRMTVFKTELDSICSQEDD